MSVKTSSRVAVTAVPCTAGSPAVGQQGVNGTPSCAVTAQSVSRVGLRVPCSRPERVAFPTPASRASVDSEIPSFLAQRADPAADDGRVHVEARAGLVVGAAPGYRATRFRSVNGTVGRVGWPDACNRCWRGW